jgi:aspartyl protease family protein
LRALLFGGLLALGVLGIYRLVAGDAETAGPSGTVIVSALAACIMLALMAGGVLRQYRGKATEALQHAALWLAIVFALVAGYAYRFELMAVRDRVVGVLLPGSAVSGAGGITSITRQGNDSFIIDGAVNSQSVRFMFDTGADSVVINAETAERLNLRLSPSDYTVTVSTANGQVQKARVQLGEVSIGSIRIQNVEALVSKPGDLAVNLLGMSFLSRLKGYSVQGDTLLLEPR